MFFNKPSKDDQIEQKIESHSNKINELEIQLSKLDQDVENFLEGLNVTAEQLSQFIESKENFSDESWTEIATHRKQLEDKLQVELENIRNPLKTKKTYSNLHVERHWLRVR